MAGIPFSGPDEAPRVLLELDGNCGPMSVWLLLRYFRKRTSAERIIRLCRYTKRHGTFTIALALALKEQGLRVWFHTEEDPAPMRIERILSRMAERAGVGMGGPLQVDDLIHCVRGGAVGIVSFDTDEGTGHFSPIIGVRKRRLILPYTEQGSMDADEFEKKWAAPGICKQCLFAAR